MAQNSDLLNSLQDPTSPLDIRAWASNDEPMPGSPTGEAAIDENDIIIAVIGPTGAGKSTFIDIAVGKQAYTAVGHGLKSVTKEIRAIRYPHPDGEKNFVLVDTPGFDDTFVSDAEILRKIAEWLRTTYERRVVLSGLLYFHSISDNRVAGTPLRNLNMFQELCGRDNFKNVLLVTTMWNKISKDEAQQREEELQNDFWHAMVRLGSTTHRFDLTEESAWDIINFISVSPPDERRPLQIQREMVDEDKPIHRASTGKAIRDRINGFFSSVKGFSRRFNKYPKGKKGTQSQVPMPPQHHRPSRLSSASSFSSNAPHDTIFMTNGGDLSSAGTPNEQNYTAALESTINTLRHFQRVEFIHINSLKEAITSTLSIARTIKVTEEIYQAVFRVVENVALLIGMIIDYAHEAPLVGIVKDAISGFAKNLRLVDGIVQNMPRSQARDGYVFQCSDFRTFLSCVNSMRHVCDVLQPKLLPQNHPVLYKINGNLAAVNTMLECSMENTIMQVIDMSHTQLDLPAAIIQGRELVALRISRSPDRPESLRDLINVVTERCQNLHRLVAFHRSVLELHPPGDPARSSLLHDFATCLWHRYQKREEHLALEESIAFERAALNLRQLGHTHRAESLHALVSFQCEYSKLGKMPGVDELIALGRATLELGPLEHPAYASSIQQLAQQVLTVDVQEAIMLTDSALKLCPTLHPDRPVLLEAIATCCRSKFKAGTKTDQNEVKKLIADVIDDTLENLPTRLVNTLTGRLCGQDGLVSDFSSSVQYKQLLSFAANSHSPIPHERIQETVSTYFKYVTLSHRWGWDEPLFRDIQGEAVYHGKSTHGMAKLQTFCAFAAKYGYKWAWSDTCCIDKESSAELQEAVGSMFSWYRQSSLTIVHLADVSDDDKLSNSEWFKRGWTLQELLAPRVILFFTQDWSLYQDPSSSNHKEDSFILAELEKVTSITSRHLKDFHPGMDDARSRLQWASTRRTTRPEDIAYSLFGVFDLHLPVLYGESKGNALGRLLSEIISQSGDISVLDWVGTASPFHSCFPAHIAVYQTHPLRSPHSDKMEPSMPIVDDLVSSVSLDALFILLTKSDRPHFLGRRLRLPCIVHRITAIRSKQSERRTHHVHEIQAEGLTPSEVVLPNEFKNDSLATSPHVLIRPWHPKLLHSSTAVGATHEQLAMTLCQPFHALLLEELPQNEYRRIVSSSNIIARAAGAASVLPGYVQTLNIV